MNNPELTQDTTKALLDMLSDPEKAQKILGDAGRLTPEEQQPGIATNADYAACFGSMAGQRVLQDLVARVMCVSGYQMNFSAEASVWADGARSAVLDIAHRTAVGMEERNHGG